MNHPPKIAAVIVARNESKNIGDCIASARKVADEVVVIDNNSDDSTREIAKHFGAKVYGSPNKGYGENKNYGNSLATFDFILSLDADERLSPELIQSILKAKHHLECSAYSFNRLNHIGGKAIKSCGWYPDKKVRLFNQNKASWSLRKVHEQVVVQSDAKIGFLEGDLLHYTHNSVTELASKTERYARLAAEELKSKPRLSILFKLLFSPAFRFVKCYLFQGGIADGRLGFALSYYQSKEVCLKYYFALKLRTPS